MGKIRTFRLWYYLRTGYQLYFAFIFAGINTMVITYYLAIERAPFLKEVFPSFPNYAVILLIIGIPLLVFTGFLHFKRVPAFKSEQEISVESNPYVYKLPPGFAKHVNMPFFLLVTKLLVKISNKEELTDEDNAEISELQKKMDHLIKGGYVGDKSSRRLPFDLNEKTE